MCGLTGYLNYKTEREVSSNSLVAMLRLQQHRGPNDSGMAVIDTTDGKLEEFRGMPEQEFSFPADLVFGFNRLSVLDVSANGHQPMTGSDQQVVLMLNGEVYNAFDFRGELVRKGYIFRSRTDTEVVLNLYLEHGFDKMIRMLNGMFAIALYDARVKKLFLSRDRFGIKPLYILDDGKRMAFASEIKSFKALPGYRLQADSSGLDEFLLFRHLIHRTLFKDIYNLPPGTYQCINPDGSFQQTIYYQLCEEGKKAVNEQGAYDYLENALNSSVQRQMISDVKLGCQLSGGVDSSLVTCYAKRALTAGQLETVSIIFKDSTFSEEKYIDYVTGQLNLASHKYELAADYYFEQSEKASWHFEQPLNHPNTIGIYLLSEEARKHVTVLLSGEGADEILAGYERFLPKQWSPWLSRQLLGGLKKNREAISLFLRSYASDDNRMIMGTAFGSLAAAKKLYPGFDLENALAQRKNILHRLGDSGLLRHRKYEMLTYLPDLLMRQDKMSMAHSIENRVPFLDNEMVSASLNIPTTMLTGVYKKKHEGKLLLKKIAANHFDEAFAFRNKMGFGIPLKRFMQSFHFRQRWQEEILPAIKKRAVFAPVLPVNIMKNIEEASPTDLETIWLMMGYETWARQYLDN